MRLSLKELWRWVERRSVGEVLQDYGVLHQQTRGFSTYTISLQLRRHHDEEKLVFKFTRKSGLGGSVQYMALDATAELQTMLSKVADDLARRLEQEAKREYRHIALERLSDGRVECPICHGISAAESLKCERCGKRFVETV